jgi:DnaK suppressor protein
MDVKDRIRDRTHTLAVSETGSKPGKGVLGGSADAGPRWRLTLERHWSEKLDEVIALTAACEGTSAAGDDVPVDTALLLSPQLHARAAAAYEELGDLADAIARVDDGTYGRCEGCGESLADDWLAREPTMRYCRGCLIGALVSPAAGR